MTCETCAHWCAITQKQLDGRLKNMAETPGGQPHPCPQCHGIDWATTTEMVGEEKPKRSWPERLKQPLSWRALTWLHGVTAVVMFGLAVITENRWVGLADAFVAGCNVGGVMHASGMIRMSRAFDGMNQAFDQMAELNSALIQDKVHLILRQGADDDSPPISPRLH